MIDSLLFLDDVTLEADPHASPAAAPSGPEALDDGEAAAATSATEAGIAHAGRAAWTAALASLEHSAAVRDALVASGAAGPAVAARGWCDVATVRLAAGDRAGAREAFVRARLARGSAPDLPAGLAAALAELDAELAPGVPEVSELAQAEDHAPAGAPNTASAAGGLLWLDTADEAGAVAGDAVAVVAVVEADATTDAPSGERPAEAGAPARIAAIDAAVALAHEGPGHEGPGGTAAAGGWRGRLRRLFRR